MSQTYEYPKEFFVNEGKAWAHLANKHRVNSDQLLSKSETDTHYVFEVEPRLVRYAVRKAKCSEAQALDFILARYYKEAETPPELTPAHTEQEWAWTTLEDA